MLVKYFDGEIKEEFINSDLSDKVIETTNEVLKLFDEMEIALAAQKIINLVDETNKYVNDTAPWALAKQEKMTECGRALYTVLHIMAPVAILIEPYCPNIAFDMAKQLTIDVNQKFASMKDNMINAGKLISKEEIHPVFLRLDSEIMGAKKKA